MLRGHSRRITGQMGPRALAKPDGQQCLYSHVSRNSADFFRKRRQVVLRTPIQSHSQEVISSRGFPKVLDAAESVVIKKITEEDEQTAKWYLKMKGGKRGYVQQRRHELTGKDEGPIEHVVKPDLAKLSNEELERLAELAERLASDSD